MKIIFKYTLFPLFIGLIFYWIFRGDIFLFHILGLNHKPILKYNSILINSFPSFITNYALTNLFLIFTKDGNKLKITLIIIFIGILFEITQLALKQHSTFDFWDICFLVFGSLISFIFSKK